MTSEYQGRPLYDFAYVHNINDRLRELADLAEKESWEYKHTESDYPNPVLYYYFHYTFERVKDEEKIAVADDGSFACFNTGLVTEHQEDLYALFSKNKAPDREPWRFVKFCRTGQYELTKFPELPDIAHYFDDPTCLVFNSSWELRSNIEHLIEVNRDRYPEPYRSMDDYALQMVLTGAIDNTKKLCHGSGGKPSA